MRSLKALLVFLISGLTLTGVSFIDGKIWEGVFIVVGMLAYAIVGFLFSIGLLKGKEAGKEAYAFVFVLILLAGYGAYKGLESLRLWILSWPLWVKILTISLIVVAIGLTIFFLVFLHNKAKRKAQTELPV